jgi:hypothetical protein
MTDKKFPPRFWLGHGYADEFGTYDWEFSEKETPSHKEEYCSMIEHTVIVAELERKLNKLRECASELLDEIDGQHELGGPSFEEAEPLRAALKEIGEG